MAELCLGTFDEEAGVTGAVLSLTEHQHLVIQQHMLYLLLTGVLAFSGGSAGIFLMPGELSSVFSLGFGGGAFWAGFNTITKMLHSSDELTKFAYMTEAEITKSVADDFSKVVANSDGFLSQLFDRLALPPAGSEIQKQGPPSNKAQDLK